MIRLSDDERTELRNTSRRLLGEYSSSRQVRAVLDDVDGFDRALWSEMAELGWLAIQVPDDRGGMGASHTDLAVVLHELGRQVTPAPVISSAVLAAAALLGASNCAPADELLARVVTGDPIMAVALCNDLGSYESASASIRASGSAASLALDGAARFVADAHVASYVIVTAMSEEEGVVLAVVDTTDPGVTVAVEPTYDQTRRLCTVSLEAVSVAADRILCRSDEAAALHRRLTSLGAIATMCDAVGAAERILEISTDYAKERHQFNRPIGSFQAVKHHLANMLTDVEASRAAVNFAVEVLDSGGDAAHAAAVAKSSAAPACARVAAVAVQVHGGIGFTWEHDAHLYLKRTKLAEALYGTAKWHRQYLGGLLVDQQFTF